MTLGAIRKRKERPTKLVVMQDNKKMPRYSKQSISLLEFYFFEKKFKNFKTDLKSLDEVSGSHFSIVDEVKHNWSTVYKFLQRMSNQPFLQFRYKNFLNFFTSFVTSKINTESNLMVERVSFSSIY